MNTVSISLSQENGKKLSCDKHGEGVAIIVWRPNGGPLLPLLLKKSEAIGLRTLLNKALGEAAHTAAAIDAASAGEAQS